MGLSSLPLLMYLHPIAFESTTQFTLGKVLIMGVQICKCFFFFAFLDKEHYFEYFPFQLKGLSHSNYITQLKTSPFGCTNSNVK